MTFTCAEKAFCVLQFAKCESIVIVQHQFRTQYHKDPPTDKPIRTWTTILNRLAVSVLVNEQTGQVCRASQDDSPLLPWPSRSPDLTPCDFFLWSYVEDHVFVPPYASRFSRAATCSRWY